jgi:C_GCAxxG_C_C family probable redox protein
MKIFTCTSRREVIGIASASLFGALATARSSWAEASDMKFKVLGESDRVHVDGEAAKILEDSYAKGVQFSEQYHGCARCTVAALQKSVRFVGEDNGLFRAASCLDGGATPDGVQSCGAFTGAGMVIGWVCGDEQFKGTELSHKLLRQVYERFEKEYGSVLCKDIREKANRQFSKVVGICSKWTAEVLLKQFTDLK